MAAPNQDVMTAVLAALRGIRADAGFRTTPAEVFERKGAFGRVGRFPAFFVETTRERVQPLPGARKRRVIRLLVTGFVRPAAGRDARCEARELMADVEDSLMRDPTLGGAAVMTHVREAAYDFNPDEQGGRAGCVVEIVTHENSG